MATGLSVRRHLPSGTCAGIRMSGQEAEKDEGAAFRAAAARFADLLPAGVETVAMRLPSGPAHLFPEEYRAMARAVPARLAEFATGRACAREALRKVGFQSAAIPQGPSREPVCRPTRSEASPTATASARRSRPAGEISSLGIDCEPTIRRAAMSRRSSARLASAPPSAVWGGRSTGRSLRSAPRKHSSNASFPSPAASSTSTRSRSASTVAARARPAVFRSCRRRIGMICVHLRPARQGAGRQSMAWSRRGSCWPTPVRFEPSRLASEERPVDGTGTRVLRSNVRRTVERAGGLAASGRRGGLATCTANGAGSGRKRRRTRGH